MNADDKSKRADSSKKPDEMRDSHHPSSSDDSEFETLNAGSSMLVPGGVESEGTVAAGAAGRARVVGTEQPGQLIGRYKLLKQVGEGGFGSVWMAEQREPVVRNVALKVIKLGMDTREVIARFEQERQALALMDHPNIAKVLDAGATDTGRPYFVMEYCAGEAITQYCDKNHFSIRERLALFVQVCEAVQHAHQKGLIHRDIKPSNILVSTRDDKPHAKVIDFGIAKATAAKLTEKTLFTAEAQLIGTPQYMSPEQAEGSLDIDTRTDVYALGVLLYELLTGVTPFDPKRLRSAAYAEIQRIIREVEPPKPSTRLAATSDTLVSVASSRRSDPRKLTTVIRGELDWIVMKALEKERQRRYETANAFAADVMRYLAGEAVTAAPPSAAYRLRKFVRRNRGPVLAAGCVAAALILGLAGTIWQARVASVQRDLARSEAARAVSAEKEARQKAAEVQKIADFQAQMLEQIDPATAGLKLTEDVRARFIAALEKAEVPQGERAALDESFANQWSRVNATDAARELIDLTILKPAMAALDKQFADQPAVAATLRVALADRYHDLGIDETAVALEQQALATRRRVLGEEHPDTLISIGNVGLYLSTMGKNDEAEPFDREALEKNRRVHGEDHPETVKSMYNMGSLLREMGQFEQAEPYLRQSLEKRRSLLGPEHPDTLNSLAAWAILKENAGDLVEAEKCYRETAEISRRVFGEDNPQAVTSLNNLAVILQRQRKLDEAITCFREVLEKRRRIYGEAHPKTLNVVQNLGTVLGLSGYDAEGETLMREALANSRRVLGADHPDSVRALSNLAVFLVSHGRAAEAAPMCLEALERRRRVFGDSHPETLIANNVLGYVLRSQRKDSEAEPYVRQTVAIALRTLGPTHPDTLIYMHNLAMLLFTLDKLPEAEQLFRDVIEVETPSAGVSTQVVLSANQNLARLFLKQDRNAEVVELLVASESLARQVYAGARDASLGDFLSYLGTARSRLKQFIAAESNLVEAHDTYLRFNGPDDDGTKDTVHRLAQFYTKWNDAEPGKGYDAKAAEWASKLKQPESGSPTTNATSAPAPTSSSASNPSQDDR